MARLNSFWSCREHTSFIQRASPCRKSPDQNFSNALGLMIIVPSRLFKTPAPWLNAQGTQVHFGRVEKQQAVGGVQQ